MTERLTWEKSDHEDICYACREKFRFRRLYNDRLPKFRVAALAAMRGAIMKGYENKTEEEREAIWEEFCRRAKATPDERKKAEE